MTIYETIKAAISVKQAAEHYGLKVNRNGMACCPFHNDRHPSLKLNEDYFFCFGCGAKGDVIDLVARLFNLTSLQAAQKLASDFGLDPKPPTAAAMVKPKHPYIRQFREDERLCFRVLTDYLHLSNEQLLDSLGLLEYGKLKRAAVLLFHRNPEKWVTGAYIKIGYFGEGSDLRYQDEIHGSLFIQADRVIELIYLKYMKAMISYDNVTRIETYPLPKAAVREAVYNAIIHSNYAALIPIQIRIHEDAVYISNDCVFPVGWTVETLMERHRSQPYNPNIANGFFRAGYVETWGRGIEKICEACKKHGVPMPEYTLHLEDIMVKFTPLIGAKVLKGQNGTLDGTLNGTFEEKILFGIKKNPHITQVQIARMLDCSERKVKRLMKMMQEEGMLERAGGRRSGQWIVKSIKNEKGDEAGT